MQHLYMQRLCMQLCTSVSDWHPLGAVRLPSRLDALRTCERACMPAPTMPYAPRRCFQNTGPSQGAHVTQLFTTAGIRAIACALNARSQPTPTPTPARRMSTAPRAGTASAEAKAWEHLTSRGIPIPEGRTALETLRAAPQAVRDLAPWFGLLTAAEAGELGGEEECTGRAVHLAGASGWRMCGRRRQEQRCSICMHECRGWVQAVL